MNTFNQHNNFLYLTAALLILLLVSPLTDVFPQGVAYWVLKSVTTATIVICYLSLNFGLWWRRFMLCLFCFMIVSGIMREYLQWNSASVLDLVIMQVFFLSAAYSAAKRVLLKGEVDGNKIVGAVAVYLLLGLIWATFYLLLLEFSPNAFNGIHYISWEDNFSVATYFSFVTLTTLGFGDISPNEPVGRMLVYLEAMVGVFYMAVVIASLVGAKAGKNHINNER